MTAPMGYIQNGMENMISSQPSDTITPQDMTGLSDEEVDQLHQEFEADAAGNIPGQAYGNTSDPYANVASGPIPPAEFPSGMTQSEVSQAVGGRRRRSTRHKRSKSRGSYRSRKHSVRGGTRSRRRRSKRGKKSRSSRKKQTTRRQKGGDLSWSKVSSDMFSDHLTPTGIEETGRLQYNVGLPKSLIDNPRVPDSVVQNRALASIA